MTKPDQFTIAHNGGTISHDPFSIVFIDSAIMYYNNQNTPVLALGKRHHEIIKRIHDHGHTDEYKKSHVDGFVIKVNDEIRFLNREDATKLAKIIGIEMQGGVLTSEDLW